MARVKLTLGDETFSRLEQHARSEGMAPNRIEQHARLEKLARDYARGRDDAESLLADLEAGQFELLKRSTSWTKTLPSTWGCGHSDA